MTEIESEFDNISLRSNHNKANSVNSVSIPKPSTSLRDNDDNENTEASKQNEGKLKRSSQDRHKRTRSVSNDASDLDTDTGLLLRRVDETVSTSNRHSLQKGKQDFMHAIEENERAPSDIDWQFWGEVMASKFETGR